jgi:HNH endonuclease
VQIQPQIDERGEHFAVALPDSWCFRIDPCDLELVSRGQWRVYRFRPVKHYVIGRAEGRRDYVALHRIIMGEPDGLTVDHEDGDTMNCRRYNLRVCTIEQNAMNRVNFRRTESGYRGVYKSGDGTWFSIISMGGKNKKQYLGIFNSPEAAARAWDTVALRTRGEYTKLNFPP